MTGMLPGLLLLSGAVLAGGLLALAQLPLAHTLLIATALLAGGSVVLNPFLGLLALVFLTQLDALSNALGQGLPASPVKLLTLLTAAALILSSWREPRSERLGPGHLGLHMAALYGCVLLVSFLFGADTPFANETVRRMLSMLLLFYLVFRMTPSVDHTQAIVVAIVASTLLSSTVIVHDWVQGGNLLAQSQAATTAQWRGMARSTGASDYDATASAAMVLVGTTLALVHALRTSRWRWLMMATVVAGSIAIVLSFARSAALVYGFAICWLMLKLLRSRQVLAVAAVGLAAGLAVLLLVPAEWWDRLATLADLRTDGSLHRRLGYQFIGIDLFLQHPVLGVGPGNFPHHYLDHDYRWEPGRWLAPQRLSNTYLEVASETGLLGLIAFLGILFAALRALHRVRAHAPSAQIATLAEAIQFSYVSYLLICLFAAGPLHKYTWILTGLAIALERIALSDRCRSGSLAGPAAGLTPRRPPDYRPRLVGILPRRHQQSQPSSPS